MKVSGRPQNNSMEKVPFVSILTCVHNQSPYFGQTVKSVLNQTYKNWEWVVLDDGSTDSTADIVRKAGDSRIRYIFQEHCGHDHLSKTFNKALRLCNGELIATLDGDDFWPANKLEIQVNQFEDPDAVLSYGEAWIINSVGRKKCYMNLPDDRSIACNDPPGSALKGLLLKRSCFIVSSTVMYRKRALSSIGGFVEAEGLGQDYLTWIRLSLEGRFAPLPFLLGYYRKHAASFSFRNPEAAFDRETLFFQDFLDFYRKELSEIGFSYDMDKLKEDWERMRAYLSYNSAVYMLMNGAYAESRAEFRRFLKRMPSLKHQCIYSLIKFSSLMRIDVLNPLLFLKDRMGKILSSVSS